MDGMERVLEQPKIHLDVLKTEGDAGLRRCADGGRKLATLPIVGELRALLDIAPLIFTAPSFSCSFLLGMNHQLVNTRRSA